MANGEKIDLWMPVFIGDYLADTQHLAAQEHGCYFLLMMAYWRNGPLPSDERQLAAICKMDASSNAWAYAWDVLKQFFSLSSDSRLHQKRIDEEIAKALINRSKKRAKAEKAANARWNKDAPSIAPSIPTSNAPAMLEQCPSPSPSPIVVDKSTTTKRRKKFSFGGFHPDTAVVVNYFIPKWPEKRKDGAEVVFSRPMLADRVSDLLNQGFTADQLKACGDAYLEEKPEWPACPQYFFGPGNGKSANFSSYAKMIIYEQTKHAVSGVTQ